MPYAPRRECTYPGCTVLVSSGRCSAHTLTKPGYSRLYATSRWKRESQAFLDEHPLCECDECGGGSKLVTAATVVDHRRPHRGDERLFFDRSNWVAMSKQHHDAKTGREVGQRSREWRGVEG